MRASSVRAGLASLLLATAPTLLAGQTEPRRGMWHVAALGGGAAFSDFSAQGARAVAGSGADEHVYRRRISAESATAVGLAAIWWRSPTWGVRLHTSYVPTSLRTRVDDDAAAFLRRTGDAPAREMGDVDLWIADAAALARLPFGAPYVLPYALAGAGLVGYGELARVERGERAPSFESRLRPAGVVGLGALVPLARGRFALQFELTDHITAAPLEPEDAGELYRSGDLIVAIDEEDAGGAGDGRIGLASHVRFVVGLSLVAPRGR